MVLSMHSVERVADRTPLFDFIVTYRQVERISASDVTTSTWLRQTLAVTTLPTYPCRGNADNYLRLGRGEKACAW